MKKLIRSVSIVAMTILLLFGLNAHGQELFSTIFNNIDNWGGGPAGSYNEKYYSEADWYFHSTSAVRGTADESYGGSEYSFRDREVFTVYNTGPVSGMSGFSMQLRDWMLGSGEDRNLKLSTDGGENWETIIVINKAWFNEYQVYQEYIYFFPEGEMSFDAEQFMIELDGGGNTNNGRINIGQFVALGESEMAVTPTFNPNGGTFFSPVDVVIESATPGANIYYSTVSEEGPWNIYENPVTVAETTTIWAYATADDLDDSNVANATFTFPELTEIATLDELRNMPVDDTYYIYTGDAIIVAMDGFRNRKFIQDETAAILIDDQPGVISTEYEIYDVITNVAGQLNVFNQMLRFQPLANTEPATENIPVEPYPFALEEVTSDDQAKLIRFENVLFVDIDEGEVFENGTNYTITDGVNEFILRTDFWNVDYTGEEIPDFAVDISGVIIQFQDILQIVPRFADDIVEHSGIDYYTVIFSVIDADGFDIDDAVITLGDITNAPGDYVFTDIEQGTYTWSISRLCYLDADGDLLVNDNLEPEIMLELDILHGDANGDGAVNVLDVIAMASDYAGNTPVNFCFHNADVNSDGAVNILDIIATINIFSEGKINPYPHLRSETAHIYLNDNGIMLESDGTIAGIQFELNGNFADVEISLNLKGHEFVYTYDNNVLKVMIYSFNNTPFPDGRIQLLTFNQKVTAQWMSILAGNLNANKVDVVTFNDNVTGITDAEDISVKVYPNPASEQLWVELSSISDSFVLSFVNIHGQTILSKNVNNAADNRFSVNLNGVPSGFYLLKLNNSKINITHSVLIKQ